MVLSSRRCPHTGVVNFYSDSEPLFAVGSIARCGTSAATPGFTWRCYTGEASSCGHAPDLKSAERQLTTFYALVEVSGDHLRLT